jgi:hypothetical protein
MSEVNTIPAKNQGEPLAPISQPYRLNTGGRFMWRWMLRTSGIFVLSSLFLTSPASAHPQFYVQFGVPGVSIGYGPGYGYYPGYYPGYAYPGFYPGYGYSYPGYVYGYPRYGYGYPYAYAPYRYGGYGHRYYYGGGRYVRPYGRAGWYGSRGHWHR